jgi:alpha-tubulin suppressor-like RCC1 family protein
VAVPATLGLASAAWPASTSAGLAARSSVTVQAWGSNDAGQLGHGTTGGFSTTPVKVHLPAGTTVTSLRGGCEHSLALTSTGAVLAWGAGRDGQLGDGSKANKNTPVKVKLPAGTTATAVRAGCEHSLALTATGHVLAWGFNALGELGTGGTTASLVPVRPKLPKGTKVKAISAGCDHSLALTTTGQVYAWGFNQNGQVGNGSNTDQHTPVRVHLPQGVTATLIAAGCNHSFALSSSGQLYGWGRNDEGQLGDSTRMDRNVPVPITIILRRLVHLREAAAPKLIAVFAGCNHTLALWANGTLLSWGDNGAGQLGDGSIGGFSDVPISVQYPSGDIIKGISAGCMHSMALTSTGQVLTWGDNSFGQLGNGTTDTSGVPAPVTLPGGRTATTVAAGPAALHGFAIAH